MDIKRTTEIFVETKRRIVVRGDAAANELIVCHVCGEPMLAVEEVAVGFGISRRAIYRFVERGAAHFIENTNGEVLPCPASLAAANSATENRTLIRTGASK